MPVDRDIGSPEGIYRDIGMSEIGNAHEAIARLIPAGRKIAYLDYALTNNVGDQLIVLGTLQFFRKYGIKRRFSRNVSNSEAAGKLPLQDDDIIVLHGGGNMGDIYPHFQKFREGIIEHYTDRKIIVMPQTVHFNERDALARAAEKMNRHPDLMLFVRDEPSLELTRPFFGERVELMPDMAHQLWPMLHENAMDSGGPPRAPLMLMRTDVEQGEVPGPIAALSDRFTDWGSILSTGFRATKRLVRMASQVGFAKSTGVDFDELYFKAMEKEVLRIANILSTSRVWLTSRLRGAILGMLLKKPVFVVDNSYGKNSSYLQAWRRYLQPFVVVRSDEEAEQVVACLRQCELDPTFDAWRAYEALSRGSPWNR